jgi:multiple sugar transport system permease protein
MQALRFQSDGKMFDVTVSVEPLFVAVRRVAHLCSLTAFQHALESAALSSIAATVVALAAGVPAAYAIARGRQRILRALAAGALLMPAALFLAPWTRVFERLTAYNTYAALTFSMLQVALPLVALVMTLYFRATPTELEDAARLDGRTPATAFFRVALPAAASGLLPAAIASLIASWNGFVWAQTLTVRALEAGDLSGSPAALTLQVLLYEFLRSGEASRTDLALMSALVSAPPLALALALGRCSAPRDG